jgi:hypothetical protein
MIAAAETGSVGTSRRRADAAGPAQPEVDSATEGSFALRLPLVRVAIVAALIAIGGIALSPASPASADDWCWDDPILLVDGQQVNINIGVKADRQTVRTRVRNAHTKVFLPRGVNASIVGYTNRYFNETAEIIYVDWLNHEVGRRIEMLIWVSFTMAPGSPSMDARVDVTRAGYRHLGGFGTTSTGVGVLQYQITR